MRVKQKVWVAVFKVRVTVRVHIFNKKKKNLFALCLLNHYSFYNQMWCGGEPSSLIAAVSKAEVTLPESEVNVYPVPSDWRSFL